MSGYARYTKLRENDLADSHEPLQKASVYLDDVTLCLSKVINICLELLNFSFGFETKFVGHERTDDML